MSDSHSRTLAKVVLYRITATIITALMIGLSKALTIHFFLMIWHYIYERIWLKINWGRN